MLAGSLTLSNKFNFILTINFIILVTGPRMVPKVVQYHRFTNGHLNRLIFIDIMMKLVSQLSPEVVNGIMMNVVLVIKATGRLIKYFSIWGVVMRVARSCMMTLSTTFQRSLQNGRLKLASSIRVHIWLYLTYFIFTFQFSHVLFWDRTQSQSPLTSSYENWTRLWTILWRLLSLINAWYQKVLARFLQNASNQLMAKNASAMIWRPEWSWNATVLVHNSNRFVMSSSVWYLLIRLINAVLKKNQFFQPLLSSFTLSNSIIDNLLEPVNGFWYNGIRVYELFS